jgi:hypothetical protein
VKSGPLGQVENEEGRGRKRKKAAWEGFKDLIVIQKRDLKGAHQEQK